jgi:NuA3 HAT complex component NTO1
MFKDGFDKLALRLRERYYTSVQDFSRDFSHEISKVVARANDQEDTGDADIEAIHNQLYEVKPGTAEHHALSHEQKEIKKLAKRIVKAVKEPLEDALKKEAALKGREHEEAIRKLDSMGIFASTRAADASDTENGQILGKRRSDSDLSAAAGASQEADADVAMRDADEHTNEAVIHLNIAGKDDTVPVPARHHTPRSKGASRASSSSGGGAKATSEKPTEPLSPPISTDMTNGVKPTTESTADPSDVFAHGGVPWYLEPFDPVGTTVHEERYTGRAVLRDMSEELSDMDEVTLTELAVNGADSTPDAKGAATAEGAEAEAAKEEKARKAAARKKARARRWR